MLGVESKIFCLHRGGTEANNLAVFDVAAARHKNRYKNCYEAKSNIRLYLRHLENLKLTDLMLSILSVDSEGRVDLDMLRNVLDDETILISVMHVNNETGVIQPIEEIREIMLEKHLMHIFILTVCSRLVK